jgi:hypothetical protein
METVIITYADDLNLAYRAAESISRYGIGNSRDNIYIVINDGPTVFSQAQTLFESINRACVYHYTDISTWIHARSGWWSQQWLKLQAYQLVSGDWYMPVDSDMYIDRSIKQSELFQGSRAYCNLRERAMYNGNIKFTNYINNACNYWQVDPEEIDLILRESPPGILHTGTVKKMLDEMTPWIFGSVEKPSIEFFLYWVYLHKNNLIDLYRHRDNWFWFGDAFHMNNG